LPEEVREHVEKLVVM